MAAVASTSIGIQPEVLFDKLSSIVKEEGYSPTKSDDATKKRCLWRLGKCLYESGLKADRDGRSLMKSMGTRLNSAFGRGFASAVLPDALQTYQAFPQEEALDDGRLSWKHYVELAQVKDPEQRKLLHDKALERGWSAASLLEYALHPPRLSSRNGLFHNTRLWARFHDDTVALYATAYAQTCGVIPVKRLRELYLETEKFPVDDFDFEETLCYLEMTRERTGSPCIWRDGNKVYLVERFLAAAAKEDDTRQRRYYEDCYREDEYRSAWEEESTTFRDQLKAWRSGQARDTIKRLARRQNDRSIKRLSHEEIVDGMPPIFALAGFERLTTELCNPRPSEIDPETGLSESAEEVQTAILRLARTVISNGLPSREEIAKDAIYLASVSGTLDPSGALVKLLANDLADLYRSLPLWTLGGFSEKELEAASQSS